MRTVNNININNKRQLTEFQQFKRIKMSYYCQIETPSSPTESLFYISMAFLSWTFLSSLCMACCWYFDLKLVIVTELIQSFKVGSFTEWVWGFIYFRRSDIWIKRSRNVLIDWCKCGFWNETFVFLVLISAIAKKIDKNNYKGNFHFFPSAKYKHEITVQHCFQN